MYLAFPKNINIKKIFFQFKAINFHGTIGLTPYISQVYF